MYPIQPERAGLSAEDIKAQCHKYMNYHVIAHGNDGSQFEGIIDGMDEEGVTMLVPEDVDGEEREFDPRQPFGYGRRRFRRFRRRRFPFFFFAFPFFRPYPYYYPYYPYYPGYGYGYGYGGGYY
ncbi:hypothetical protein [Paenibacillus sp. GYB003]|uniref:hypothetical protein n=1 Tax=Paenibacillus sp. GYB003 TaxID=2994392 RepID=UPI002F96388C